VFAVPLLEGKTFYDLRFKRAGSFGDRLDEEYFGKPLFRVVFISADFSTSAEPSWVSHFAFLLEPLSYPLIECLLGLRH
jgi:hypothetical protein